jgi:putative FmdB family regulatory protein
MPIYEYRCSSCGQQQESLQKLSDAPLTICAACGKPTLAKMLTAAGFQLKGSGWYATDFKTKPSAPAKGDAQSESKSESKSEAKPEAKSEAKSEAAPAPAAVAKGDGGKATT